MGDDQELTRGLTIMTDWLVNSSDSALDAALNADAYQIGADVAPASPQARWVVGMDMKKICRSNTTT